LYRKIIILLISLSLIFPLTACKSSKVNSPNNNGKDNPGETKDPIKDEVLVYKDDTNLMEIHVSNKRDVEVYFNLERWEGDFTLSQIGEGGDLVNYFNKENWRELLDIEDRSSMGDNYYGPFPIISLAGEVKDMVIGQIAEFDYANGLEQMMPTIFILMDDGQVYYVYADIFSIERGFTEFHASGPLPWVENIESLAYESDGEGMDGTMTAYAVDKQGAKYDLRIPGKFQNLYMGMDWVSNENAEDPNYEFSKPEYCAVLNFLVDGTVSLKKGWTNEEAIRYKGTYRVSMGEDDNGPGIMFFDLHLDSTTPYAEETINGSYFADLHFGISLELFPGDGDLLFVEGRNEYEPFKFIWGYSPFDRSVNSVRINDYGDYLINNSSHIREMVTKHKMSLLETGETREIGDELCTDIWLGTNHKDNFVKEILYTISDTGNIYEYDPIGDGWFQVWN